MCLAWFTSRLIIVHVADLMCRVQSKLFANRKLVASRKGVVMNAKKGVIVLSLVLVVAASSGCSTPLSTREKGAGIGALGGATAGGLIGAAVGHPAAGAAIGGGLGLGAGALVGDQLQGQEQTQYRQQQQIDQNQAEIQRQRQQIDQLKRRQEY